MYTQLKKLFSESVIYSLGSILRRSFSMITMPVFTRAMTVSDYGILSIVNAVMGLMKIFYELGVGASATRYYYECNNDEERTTLFSTLFIFMLTFAIVVSMLIVLFAEPLWNRFVKEVAFFPYVVMGLTTVSLGTIFVLARTLFRVQGRASAFVKISFLQTVLFVTVSIPAVVFLRLGAIGPLAAGIAVGTVFFPVSVFFLRKYLRFRFSRKVLKKCLAFGIPDMPTQFGNVLLKTANQFLLEHYWSVALVGLYSVAFAVANILFELIITAVHWAVQPFYYQMDKEESEEKAKEIFSYVAMINTTVILFLGLFAIFLGRELLVIFASSKYADAEPAIVTLAVSAIFQYLYFIPSRVLYLKKKTIYLPPLLFLAVACNIGLSVLFIPEYGIIGAAWATLLSFLVRTVITLIISQRVYYVPYDYLRISKAVLAFLVVFYIKDYLPAWPIHLLIPLKLAILSLYPVLLLAFGFFEKRELRWLWQVLFQRKPKTL